MKSVVLLIGACIVILLLGAVMTGVNDFRMEDQVATYDVTTGGGVTTADVTLTEALFGGETYNAAVSSNITGDTPLASAYVAGTKALTVSGLDASSTRRLTVTYKIDAQDAYPGAGLGASVIPVMIILGCIGLVAAAAYSAIRSN